MAKGGRRSDRRDRMPYVNEPCHRPRHVRHYSRVRKCVRSCEPHQNTNTQIRYHTVNTHNAQASVSGRSAHPFDPCCNPGPPNVYGTPENWNSGKTLRTLTPRRHGLASLAALGAPGLAGDLLGLAQVSLLGERSGHPAHGFVRGTACSWSFLTFRDLETELPAEILGGSRHPTALAIRLPNGLHIPWSGFHIKAESLWLTRSLHAEQHPRIPLTGTRTRLFPRLVLARGMISRCWCEAILPRPQLVRGFPRQLHFHGARPLLPLPPPRCAVEVSLRRYACETRSNRTTAPQHYTTARRNHVSSSDKRPTNRRRLTTPKSAYS